MREVSLTWEAASLAETDLSELNDVVDNLTFVANLLITPDGVRQVILPSFKEGKTADDLNSISYIEVEQRFSDREGEGLVVWNTHALVCLASSTGNIHVMPPTVLEEGNLTLTVRGLPDAISTFVKMSKAFFPPASVRVSDIRSHESGLEQALTPRQHECYALAIEHGFYEDPKTITMQALADLLGIARSTFQEHLQSAEQAVLVWAGLSFEGSFSKQTFDEHGNLGLSWTKATA